MKFTAGYLLGATTVVGVVGSFFVGAIAMDYINNVKKEVAVKVEDASVSSTIRDIMNSRRN